MKKTPAKYELTMDDVQEAIAQWLFNEHGVGNEDPDDLIFIWSYSNSVDSEKNIVTVQEEEDE